MKPSHTEVTTRGPEAQALRRHIAANDGRCGRASSEADRFRPAHEGRRIAAMAVAVRVALAGRAVGLGQHARAHGLPHRDIAERAIGAAALADRARRPERRTGAAVLGRITRVEPRAIRARGARRPAELDLDARPAGRTTGRPLVATRSRAG